MKHYRPCFGATMHTGTNTKCFVSSGVVSWPPARPPPAQVYGRLSVRPIQVRGRRRSREGAISRPCGPSGRVATHGIPCGKSNFQSNPTTKKRNHKYPASFSTLAPDSRPRPCSLVWIVGTGVFREKSRSTKRTKQQTAPCVQRPVFPPFPRVTSRRMFLFDGPLTCAREIADRLPIRRQAKQVRLHESQTRGRWFSQLRTAV